MPSELKTLMVNEIDRCIGSSTALVLLGMVGLKGMETVAMRHTVSEANAKMFHLKNSLAKRVFESRGWEGFHEGLIGPTAILFGDDPVSIARLAKDFAKAYPDRVELRQGWLLGKLCSKDEVRALADLPPYEEMVAMFLATIASPVNNLIAAVSSPINNLTNVLEQISESKEESKAS